MLCCISCMPGEPAAQMLYSLKCISVASPSMKQHCCLDIAGRLLHCRDMSQQGHSCMPGAWDQVHWLPAGVTCFICRFWHKVLYDIGVVSTKEPFQCLVSQGMILGEVSAPPTIFCMS